MKWLKRLLAALVLIAILLIGAGLVLKHLSRQRPDWYPVKVMDEASRKLAANSVEDKLVGVRDWAMDATGHERNRRSGIKPGAPGYVQAPDPVRHLTFTEAELNAVFNKWDDQMKWKQRYSHYVEDPVLVLQDEHLIMAGTIKELDMLVSIHLTPSLDADGNLRLTLDRVMGGRLPLPHALWDSYRERLANLVADRIEESRQNAAMTSDGSMNTDAMIVSMNKLLLRALNSEPADPILFFHNDNHSNLPVKLTQVKIADKTIEMTVVLLDPTQREALLKRIREPYEDMPVAARHEPSGTDPAAGNENAANGSPGVQHLGERIVADHADAHQVGRLSDLQ